MYQVVWFESLISLIIVHLLLKRLLNARLRTKVIIALLPVVIPVMVISAMPRDVLPWSGTVTDIISVFCVFFTLYIPFFTVSNISKKQILYVSLLFCGVSAVMSTTFFWISDSFNLEVHVILAVDFIIYNLLLLFSIRITKNAIVAKLYRQMLLIPNSLKVFIVISLWFVAVYTSTMAALFRSFPPSLHLVTIECMTAVLIVGLGIMFPLLIVNSISNAYYRTVLSDIEKQMHEQVKHYELMIKADTDIRKFRHDFKNLKIGFKAMLENQNFDAVIEFIHEFDKPFNSQYIMFETGNPVADALLSEKQEAAHKIKTRIKFDGLIPRNSIRPVDLCVVLGNSLDNALESCSLIKSGVDKVININAQYNNGFLFLTITNPICESVPVTGNIIPTSKDDKKSHGFGLFSIQCTIQNYGGSMEILCKDNIFILKLDFDLNFSL